MRSAAEPAGGGWWRVESTTSIIPGARPFRVLMGGSTANTVSPILGSPVESVVVKGNSL
jgi:hypothetical protein